jgi:hypothetical protein
LKRACVILVVALCLVAVISTLSVSVTQNDIQAAPASFTIPEMTPTPTPTPAVTPTPTATPAVSPTPTPESSPTATPTGTPAPTPTPAGGGGGNSQPSISVKLTIDILGQETQWLRSAQGKILEDIYALSEDGSIAIEIAQGTYARDTNGDPLSEISLILTDPLMKAPDAAVPDDSYLIGTYEFWPDGATFSKPINITVFYDTAELPKAPDELTFTMYSLDNEPYEWTAIPIISDIGSNSVLVSINYLSTFALTAVPLDTSHISPDSPLPDITPPASDKSNLILLVLLLPAMSLTLFIFAFRRRRRSSNTPVDADLPPTAS